MSHYSQDKESLLQHLLHSPNLYGRQIELEKLITAFDRACHGGKSLYLLQGKGELGNQN